MAECFACHKTLQGAWNTTSASSSFEKTGRYLGINDGYFLYGEQPNWVYCYCKTCWQSEVLKLSFVSKVEQLNSLQQQLDASRAESASYKNQFDEINERYNKLSKTSGVQKLQDLFKQLNTSQIDALHAHTKFRVDTFETVHDEQQLQSSTQFVQMVLMQLKSSVDAVIQLQKTSLPQRKQAKENVIQTLITAGVPKDVIDASTKPLDTEIEQIEANIKEWDTFSAVLINTINQSNIKSQT
jgi:chromosome segregation ATPase